MFITGQKLKVVFLDPAYQGMALRASDAKGPVNRKYSAIGTVGDFSDGLLELKTTEIDGAAEEKTIVFSVHGPSFLRADRL